MPFVVLLNSSLFKIDWASKKMCYFFLQSMKLIQIQINPHLQPVSGIHIISFLHLDQAEATLSFNIYHKRRK